MSSLIQGGGQMVESATRALNQVNKLISDENIADLSATIKDVRLTMGELAENRAMFDHAGSMLAKLDSAATDIEASAALIREMGEGDGRRTLAEMSEAATELKAAIGEARGTLAHINRQSETIGTTTLPAVNAAMHSLQETSESLDGFLREIRQNPRRALTKDSGQELELPR
jgi:phospholipid/cholesterol/gamma-HCH transport system substrate-binding protein